MQGYPCKGPNKKDKTTFIAPFSVSMTVREKSNEALKRYYWCGIPKNDKILYCRNHLFSSSNAMPLLSA